MNPRVLSDNGLAIHRLAELGHLRFRSLRKSISFLKVFISIQSRKAYRDRLARFKGIIDPPNSDCIIIRFILICLKFSSYV